MEPLILELPRASGNEFVVPKAKVSTEIQTHLRFHSEEFGRHTV